MILLITSTYMNSITTFVCIFDRIQIRRAFEGQKSTKKSWVVQFESEINLTLN